MAKIHIYQQLNLKRKQTKQTRTETESWVQRAFCWLTDGTDVWGEWVKR